MRSWGLLTLVAMTATVLLLGCGGGGGSSPTGSFVQPTAGPTATPTTAPSSAPTASPLSFSARIVDTDHGNAAVAGATVTLGTAIAYNGTAYVVGGTTTTAKSALDGTFTAAGIHGQLFIEIDAPGLVSLHRPLPATSANLGTLALPTATSEDLSGLAELNKHRANLGNGAGARPLTLDADLELLARYRVNDMATKGYYGHTPPGQTRGGSEIYLCTIAVGAFCATPLQSPMYDQENLDVDVLNQVEAEDNFIDLGPNDGHYQNIVSKTNCWVGFGEVLNGKVAPGLGGSFANYFAQEFFTSTANPDP